MVIEEVYEKITNNESRLTKIETTLEEHTRLLLKQENKNEDQVEFNTIIKMNMEQMKKFGETIDRVNDNLTNLNSNQERLNVNQHQLSERVDGIETSIKETKKSTFKGLLGFLKYLGGIGIGILVAIVYKKLGL